MFPAQIAAWLSLALAIESCFWRVRQLCLATGASPKHLSHRLAGLEREDRSCLLLLRFLMIFCSIEIELRMNSVQEQAVVRCASLTPKAEGGAARLPDGRRCKADIAYCARAPSYKPGRLKMRCDGSESAVQNIG